MPIVTQNIEPQLWLATCTGSITLRDIREAQHESLSAFWDENIHYVLIADISDAVLVDLHRINLSEIKAFWDVEALHNNQGILIVGASRGIRILANVTSRIFGMKIECFNKLDEALDHAHQMLQTHNTRSPYDMNEEG